MTSVVSDFLLSTLVFHKIWKYIDQKLIYWTFISSAENTTKYLVDIEKPIKLRIIEQILRF